MNTDFTKLVISFFLHLFYNAPCSSPNHLRENHLHTQIEEEIIRKFSEQNLSTLSTDAASKLDVLWHDSDTLGVDGA